MLFDTVTIIGVGLVGGSLGFALKDRQVARRIIGVGHRRSSMQRACDLGAIDEMYLEIEGAVSGSDWVILATSVRLIPEHARRAAMFMKRGAILSDVGSTKAEICAELDKVARNDLHIIGMHPLAGSDQRGIDAARKDLFESTTCILTPGDRTDPDAVERVTKAWQALGAKVQTLGPERHDELLARASHLPHVIAATLLNALSEQCLPFGGSGLRDVTRIASGDPDLWRDICAANRAQILKAIDQFRGKMDEFARALCAQDDELVRSLLAAAKERRDNLPAARLRNKE